MMHNIQLIKSRMLSRRWTSVRTISCVRINGDWILCLESQWCVYSRGRWIRNGDRCLTLDWDKRPLTCSGTLRHGSEFLTHQQLLFMNIIWISSTVSARDQFHIICTETAVYCQGTTDENAELKRAFDSTQKQLEMMFGICTCPL